jgi:hypothetical protein
MTRALTMGLVVALALSGRSDAVTPSGPQIELFVTRLLSAIQPDGRIEVEQTFDCGDPDEEKIVLCFDKASGVGFRFRPEGPLDVISVPIVLHDGKPVAVGSWPGHYPVASQEEYRRLEAAVAQLPEAPALQALGDCSFALSPNSTRPLVWFAKQNAVADTRILFLLGASAFSIYGLRGFYNRSLDGYQVGELVIANGIETPCGTPD